MFQKYFFLFNYLLIILVGFSCFSKVKHSLLIKVFLLFLMYSLISEVTGMYFVFYAKINTAVINNTWNIVNYTFYTFLFYNLINNNFKRKVILILVGIFLILEIVNMIFYQNYFTEIFRYNSIMGKVFLVILVLMYFAEVLEGDKIINFNKSIFSWISLGVLIYSIGFIPVFVIAEFIEYKGIFRYITFGLNILMSFCFITGFIVSKKEFNN